MSTIEKAPLSWYSLACYISQRLRPVMLLQNALIHLTKKTIAITTTTIQAIILYRIPRMICPL